MTDAQDHSELVDFEASLRHYLPRRMGISTQDASAAPKNRTMFLPTVIPHEDEAFRRIAADMGVNVDDPWVGGYVEYEWEHGRHIFETLGMPLAGAEVLEFGCNVGASAVVLGALGARVTALDVNEEIVQLARANVARYQLADTVRLLHTPDSSNLPFNDGAFDLVCCNSVLEYVPCAELPAVMAEIDRLLKPGAIILVTGTSSRLWPREVHSGRWGVNWLPRGLDRILGSTAYQRGIWPKVVRYGFGTSYENMDRTDHGVAWLEARRRTGSSSTKWLCLRLFNNIARMLGTSAGLLTPNIAVRLRKLGAPSQTISSVDGADAVDSDRLGTRRPGSR